MRARKYVSASLLVSLFLTLAFVNSTSAQTKPTIKVEPTYYTAKAGGTFYANMYIYDVDYTENTEVHAWQVSLIWDSAVLDVDDTVIWGDFMDVPRIGPWGTLTANAEAGATILNVEDGSKFWEPGVWAGKVVIQDDFNSEENEVIDAIGNQLTVKNPLANTYTLAAGGGAYPWPTLWPSVSISTSRNRILASLSTQGYPPGVSGSGWLCTFKFYVLSESLTTLDLDHSVVGMYTYIMNTIGETFGDDPSGGTDPGYWQSELLKESGEFILPWDEDIDGDGTVGIFDLSSVAIWWGETVPPAPEEVDLNNDGVINVVDLTLVSIKYGTYANA